MVLFPNRSAAESDSRVLAMKAQVDAQRTESDRAFDLSWGPEMLGRKQDHSVSSTMRAGM